MTAPFPVPEPRARTASLAVVQAEAWHSPWVRALLRAEDIRVLIAETRSVDDLLDTLSARSAVLVVEELPTIGLPAVDHIWNRVEAVRARIPQIAVAFAADPARPIDARALPPLVRTLRPRDGGLTEFLAEARATREETLWEIRNARVPQVTPIPGRTSFSHWAGTVPNFNIKHPSMLLPYAILSARTGREVYCEISPKEALLFLGGSVRDGVAHGIADVFGSLVRDVRTLNEALGSRLRLHLDHADDFESIQAACRAGFDSVMADGSARTLEQNIRFTRDAAGMAAGFGLPVEGEIGDLDSAGPRKWGATTVADFRRFVEGTGVDFAGAHVGQFHSFDYDLVGVRRAVGEVGLIDARAGGDDLNAFASACLELDRELAGEGFPESAEERRLVARLARMAVTEDAAGGMDRLLSGHRANVRFRHRPVLDRLELGWLSARTAKARAKLDRWDEVFRTHQPRDHRHAVIDHQLIAALTEALEGGDTRLVLHGGSSIARLDLGSLAGHGIARVNFGSEVFSDYLTALRANMPADREISLRLNHNRALSFLDEAARGWREWTANPPSFVEAFVDRLEQRYLIPLNDYAAEAQE